MYNKGGSVSVWRAPGVWRAQSWGSGLLALDLSLTGCFRQVAQSPCPQSSWAVHWGSRHWPGQLRGPCGGNEQLSFFTRGMEQTWN